VTVDDCDFSAAPVWPNADWPLDRPVGVKPTRIADLYEQKSRYVVHGLPTRSEHVEVDSGPNGCSRCRIVEETTVTQQVVKFYCVKTFAPLRRKLSWKKVGMGALAVAGVASLAVPILIPVHVATIVATVINAAGASSTAAGTFFVTLAPAKERRDPHTEKTESYECLGGVRTEVTLIEGPWRSCRATDSTHLECIHHG
jgi:hypothetical protein